MDYRYFINVDFQEENGDRGYLVGVYSLNEKTYYQEVRFVFPSKDMYRRNTYPSISIEEAEKLAKGFNEKSCVYHNHISIGCKINDKEVIRRIQYCIGFFIEYYAKVNINNVFKMVESAKKLYNQISIFESLFENEEYVIFSPEGNKFDFITDACIDNEEFVVIRENGEIKFEKPEDFIISKK